MRSDRSLHAAVLLMLGVVALFGAAGCEHVAYSAPGRVNMMETASTPDTDRNRVALAVGGHAGILGISTTTGSTRYSRGISDTVALSAEAGVVRVDKARDIDDIHPFIYTGRVAAKIAPEGGNEHVAFEFGTGGGTSTGGQFISPDAGIFLSYDLGAFEPFIHGYGFVSVPFNTRPIRYDYPEVAGSSTDRHVIEAETTLGGGGYAGTALDLTYQRPETATRHEIILGLGYMGLARVDGEGTHLISIGGGYQVEF